MIETTEIADKTLIGLAGRIDSTNSGQIEAAILDRVRQGATRVVLDFSRLDYISSAGLRVVLILAKKLKQTGGRLAVCALKPNIHSIFEVSGFLPLLKVCATSEEALDAVGA